MASSVDLLPGRLPGGHIADVVDEHVDAAEVAEPGVGHALDVRP